LKEKFAMRKHIYGVALFIFIVACGAVAYALFLAPAMEVNTTSRYCPKRIPATVSDPDPIPESPKPGPLAYKIKSFYLDLETGGGTVEVQLDWNSSEKPPAGVRLDFGLTTPGEPFSGKTVGYDYVHKPFEKGRSVTKTCRFMTSGDLDPKVKNYYGYAEVTDAAGVGSGITKTVLVEKNRMAGAMPVLMGHPNKK
jgi:hypothetical protein